MNISDEIEIFLFGDGGSGGCAEPYTEETYDENGELTNIIMHGYTKIRGAWFYDCSELALTSLPEGITSIEQNAFRGCAKVTLSSFPSSLTIINDGAFTLCNGLIHITIPASVVSILSNAFIACSGLTSVTFEGTPTSIENIFSQCSSLTLINVPWAEGTVTGAPWGATNATITYNYAG